MKLISHAVYVIAALVIEKQCALAQNSQHVSESEEDFEASLSIEQPQNGVPKRLQNHTFVALLDISFTDGAKRMCTGTIIHDKVVISAAHCFADSHDKYSQPELTTSFVVIGSKRMFEMGYEKYLPIERVVNHPLYKGWTADIALVFTFVGMMSDKGMTIMPLAGEKMSTPVHTNLTILSWGICCEQQNDLKLGSRSRLQRHKNSPKPFSSSEDSKFLKQKNKKKKTQLRFEVKHKSDSKEDKVKKTEKVKKTDKVKKTKSKNEGKKKKKHSSKTNPVTKGVYRAIASEEEDTDNVSDNYEYQNTQENKNEKRRGSRKNFISSFFKNWRRSTGRMVLEVGVETFGIIDSQACKELVKKSMPEHYKLKNPKEYICYSSDDYYITDEDSGAPAVRHGQLMGVTVGGVECEDDHVAVGIRISCFCSWIAENLPDGGPNMKCCDHCCDEVKPTPASPDVQDLEDDVIKRSKKKKSRF